jgi:ketosteroid isomerase-like protein
MTPTTIDDLIARWTTAERAGDHASFEDLVADDFLFAGPLGFLLDKTQWLERYRGDHLHYTHFAVEDARTRTYGGVAVVVGVQEQRGDHEGRPVDGRFRLTLVLATADDSTRIVSGHLSPIAAPPAAA